MSALRNVVSLRIFSATLCITFLLATAPFIDAQARKSPAAATDVKIHRFHPTVTTGQTGSNGQPAVTAAQQIQALMAEKQSRTKAQQKISSRLLHTARVLMNKPMAPGLAGLETDVELDANNDLFVDISATVTSDFLNRLQAAGVKVIGSYPKYQSVRALVPPGQLETVAAWPEVKFIHPRREAITENMTGGGLASGFSERAARVRSMLSAALPITPNLPGTPGPTGQGSQTSEGDLTHRAYDARTTFGINGAGVKIGVLSDGVANLAASQALGDLGPVTVLPGQDGVAACTANNAASCDEGTAMLEVIHDIAPGAQLYFATAFGSIESFAQNIRDLRAAGCDIIVDDVFYFVETPFHDGQPLPTDTNGAVVIQAVNDVTASGAMYFSSAGNSGNQTLGSTGNFEGVFVDGGAATGVLAGAGRVNLFSPGITVNQIVASGGPITLYWADPLGGSTNDYDLYVLNSTGTLVAFSADTQNGSTDPFEAVGSTTDVAGNRTVVALFSGNPVFFHLDNNRGRIAISTEGMIHGHNSAANAFGVAAVPAHQPFTSNNVGPWPNPFNATNFVESFSSDGPRRIFFKADGSPYTAGNFTQTGGIVRQKPDITAADGIAVTGVGNFPNPFYGTSAAAPHAAAIAALVKSAKPVLTSTEVGDVLKNTAIDIMSPGVDRDSGAGIIMAFEAVKSLGVPGTANPEFGAITVRDNPGNNNGAAEAGEGGILTIELQNVAGVADATAIKATLTTSTPGISITQPATSTYADLVKGTGSGLNQIPFTFTLANDLPCGTTAEFTLNVEYTGGPSPRVLQFSIPTGPQAVQITNNLGTTPTGTPDVTTATGTQNARIFRTGTPVTCATTPKSWPGTGGLAGIRAFDSYSFTSCHDMCATIDMSADFGIAMYSSIYSPNYDPTNIQTNFIGDNGSSQSHQLYSVQLNSGASYSVVINETDPGFATGAAYTLTLPGCAVSCATPNIPPVAQAKNVVVLAGVGGVANVSVDNGSFSPSGKTLTVTQTPPSPYSVGVTPVLLTVVDSFGATAQANATVTVTQSTSTVVNAVSPTYGSTVLSATVTAVAAQSSPASTSVFVPVTGSVTFSEGSTQLGTAALDAAGNANLNLFALPAGAHNIVATYTGNDPSQASASASTAVTIAQAPLTVVTNDKSMIFGSAVPTLDGAVTGLVLNDPITATFSTTGTTASNVGPYPITATLSDPQSKLLNYAVTNAGGTLTITPAASVTTLASSGTTHVGESVTLTATVTSTAGTPAGSVAFLEGTTTLGTATLASGTATFHGSLPLGTHSVVAQYQAAGNFAASTSAAVAANVIAPVLNVSSPTAPQTVKAGSSAVVALQITAAGTPSSSITFACSGLPTGATCTFNPASVAQTSLPAQVNMTITTTGLRLVSHAQKPSTLPFALFLPGMLLLPALASRKRKKLGIAIGMLMLIVLLIAMSGCGTSSKFNTSQTPAGTFPITVTATSNGSTQGTSTFNLTVVK